MPRQEVILPVFVGSPGDVSDEREALESIVTELNKSWSRTLGLRLELIRWETDIYPGFGDDPQQVINNQINDEYDVFIGIFWGRIGTATKREISGTIEEFKRVYERYKKDNNSVDILLYFKDAALPPSKIDPKQLKDLMEFKSSLGERGALYWEFESLTDFEAILRPHLSAIGQKWANKTISNYREKLKSDEEQFDDITTENELGFLDYLEIFEDLTLEMTASLNHMAEATVKIGESLDKRTASINQIGEIDNKSKMSRAKKIMKLSAQDMERYSSVLNTQLPILTKSRVGALDALSQAVTLYSDFDIKKDDLNIFEDNIKKMRESAMETKVSMSQFRDTIRSLPRIITQVNRAKKKVVLSLDRVLKETSSTINVTQNIIDSVAELKAKMNLTMVSS